MITTSSGTGVQGGGKYSEKGSESSRPSLCHCTGCPDGTDHPAVEFQSENHMRPARHRPHPRPRRRDGGRCRVRLGRHYSSGLTSMAWPCCEVGLDTTPGATHRTHAIPHCPTPLDRPHPPPRRGHPGLCRARLPRPALPRHPLERDRPYRLRGLAALPRHPERHPHRRPEPLRPGGITMAYLHVNDLIGRYFHLTAAELARLAAFAMSSPSSSTPPPPPISATPRLRR